MYILEISFHSNHRKTLQECALRISNKSMIPNTKCAKISHEIKIYIDFRSKVFLEINADINIFCAFRSDLINGNRRLRFGRSLRKLNP